MRAVLVIIAAAGVLSAGVAFAQSGADVLKAKGCMNCHEMDKKKVGPAYKDVAAKYKGDKAAEAKLADKIMKGGSGVWGQIPMPANPQVSADEAKTLAKWVLGL